MKAFLKQLTDEFDISPSGTHVAVVAYSTNPRVVFKFNTLQGSQLNTDKVKKLLDSIPHQRGLTYIDRALLFADGEIFTVQNGMRPQVTKVLLSRLKEKDGSVAERFKGPTCNPEISSSSPLTAGHAGVSACLGFLIRMICCL